MFILSRSRHAQMLLIKALLLVTSTASLSAADLLNALPAKATDAAPAIQDLAQASSLSLRQALDLAKGNFSLDIAAAQIQVQAALSEQAKRLPNPLLNASAEEFPSLAGNTGEFTLQWQQALPISERITQQTRLAEQKKLLAQVALDLQALALQRDLTQSYYQVLTWQVYLQQSETLQQTAQAMRQLLEAQANAGKILLVEVNRARLLEQELQLQTQNASLQWEQAKIQLALFWNQDRAMDVHLSEALMLHESLPEIDPLRPNWQSHPEGQQAEQSVQQQAINLNLQEALVWPDLKWSLGLRYIPYQNNLAPTFGLSLPLPINNANQGAIDAAQAQVYQAQTQQQAAQVRFNNRQQQSLLTYQNSLRSIERFREQILPVAKENMSLNQVAFEAGKLPYLALLNAQKSLNSLQLDYIKLWGDYHQQRADLVYFSQSSQLLESL